MTKGTEGDLAAAFLDVGDGDVVERSLAFVRQHLGMEVAYLSEFVGDDLVFRATDAPGFEEQVHVGGKMPLDHVYCRHILAGRLPQMIPDTNVIPYAQEIPLTKAVPIGSHVSIPVLRADGTPYGMFCCLSRSPNPSLNARDLDVMRAFAALSGEQVRASLAVRARQDDVRARITGVMGGDLLDIFFQPIVSLASGEVVGLEALSRFQTEPVKPPNLWFDEAGEIGAMVDLELYAIEKAASLAAAFPDNIYVSVNASPDTVQSGRVAQALAAVDMANVVLEVTEHHAPKDPASFEAELLALRQQGVRLAIDDVGAGYSGLQRMVGLQPDIIKLDMSLTSGVHLDVARRSLVTALVGFANETAARIVAEGVEQEDEALWLARVGIDYAQGFHFGRPASASDIRERIVRAS